MESWFIITNIYYTQLHVVWLLLLLLFFFFLLVHVESSIKYGIYLFFERNILSDFEKIK